MSIKIYDMTVNHMPSPAGVDDTPHFSYKLALEGTHQVSYRLLVSDKDGLVWDSGRRMSDNQVMIPCEGQLAPCTAYTWQVEVTDDKGSTAISEPASFSTGMMKPFGWDAKWITADPQSIFIGNKWCTNTTAPYLRRSFSLKEAPVSATLYISGLGYYECYINGISVKDTYLDPAFTEYDKTVMYKTYDIASLTAGENVIAVSLGDGFYNADSDDAWNFVSATWRDHSKCLLRLVMTFSDGHTETIVSDKNFRGTKGPYLANDVRSLDIYDARRDLGDWTLPGYDDSSWGDVTITKAPGGALSGQYTTPIKETRRFAVKSIRKISDTRWLVDAGENTSGWLELSVEAPAGTEFILRYGEDFDENLERPRAIEGCLKPNEKYNFQCDHYIASGKGREIWHPCFKYHGFRYVLVICESGIPENMSFEVCEIRTALEKAGTFVCSDDMLNRVQDITCRATRTNFHNMPTDCPHREKNGWTGDAQLSAEQLLFNYDGAAAYWRWMDDIIRAQRPTGQLPGIIPSTGWGFNWGSGPAWDSVVAVLPYTLYVMCGDKAVLQKAYPAIKKYVGFCDTMAVDGICEFGLGDWCPPADEWHKNCDLAVTDTAYYYYDTLVASKAAAVLGYENEAAYYAGKAYEIRQAFRRRFIKRADDVLELNCVKCQTSLACMMYYGMIEESEKPLFLRELIHEIDERDGHLDVGILGAKYVCNVLIDCGRADLVAAAASSPEYPGWGYMVAQGATTLWEDWKGGSSQNHHMFGDISACFYKGLAGLNADENKPGFKNTIFRPQFVPQLSYARADHMTPYGKVSIGWEKKNGAVEITLTVPDGCTGELHIPQGYRCECGCTSRVFDAGTYTVKAIEA